MFVTDQIVEFFWIIYIQVCSQIISHSHVPKDHLTPNIHQYSCDIQTHVFGQMHLPMAMQAIKTVFWTAISDHVMG